LSVADLTADLEHKPTQFNSFVGSQGTKVEELLPTAALNSQFEHQGPRNFYSACSVGRFGQPKHLSILPSTSLKHHNTDMNRPLATRKRGAPGASPLSQQQNLNNMQFTGVPDQTQYDQSFNDWGVANGMGELNNGFLNDGTLDSNVFNAGMNGAAGFGGVGAGMGAGGVGNDFTNGQLVRRPPAQQAVSRNPNAWQDTEAGAGTAQGFEQPEEEDDLEQKALVAKKEAQSKRKQIPPFVQKLSR
jgi:hypothetical protein